MGVHLEIVGKDDLQSLDQVVAFNKLTGLESLELRRCPPLEWKQLLMLTSLKRLYTITNSLDGLVGPSGGEADVEWQHPVVQELHVVPELLDGPSGKELTELLTHLPKLSKLNISSFQNITKLPLGVVVQQTSSAATSEVKKEEEEEGLLLFPAHLSDSLRELVIENCPELVLMDHYPSTFLPATGGGGFQALRSLQMLRIYRCPKILSVDSPSCCLFPPSLQYLRLWGVEGMGTLEPLSNLTSLTKLYLWNCGEELRCKGLGPILTTGGQLRELTVIGSPRFFAGWDPNPRRVLQDGGEEQELQQQQLVSPTSPFKLQELRTDDPMGLLVAPTCSFLSSSLTVLTLYGTYTEEMERFTKEQEDALHLLASLQELEFSRFNKLQSLPAGLHKLANLKQLEVSSCPAVRSLLKDGLPKSLQEIDVYTCGNKEMEQQCRGLVGTIPKIILQLEDY